MTPAEDLQTTAQIQTIYQVLLNFEQRGCCMTIPPDLLERFRTAIVTLRAAQRRNALTSGMTERLRLYEELLQRFGPPVKPTEQ